MDKKIKRFATTTIICVLVASIFGTVMVLAPPPDLVFPPLINAFITNTSEDPVPVEVTDQLESLEVTIPDGVEVTNTEGIPVDVSGWLHTTESGMKFTLAEPFDWTKIEDLSLTGYRRIALTLNAYYVDCEFRLVWFALEPDGYKMYEETLTVNADDEVFLQYDVFADYLSLYVKSLEIDDGNSLCVYYMTT